MMIQQEFIGGEEKGTGAAADIGDRESIELLGALAFDERPDRALGDRVRDEGWCRNDTTAFPDLRLADDLDPSVGDGDHITKKLLVNLSQHFGLNNGEGVRASRVVQFVDNAPKGVVADADSKPAIIKEPEEAGIIELVGASQLAHE